MFEKYLEKEQIYNHIKLFSPAKSINDRTFWDKAALVFGDNIQKEIAIYDKEIFLPLKASMYREFVTKKDRENFEHEYMKRRNALLVYTVAEACENKGNHIEKITDLVWMILEETDWAVPAHLEYLMHTKESLPDYEKSCLDIMAGETGKTLALVYLILKDKLDAISVNISDRIKKELEKRILQNYLTHTDYWYLGLDPNAQQPNNWNPWVNGNVLFVALSICTDKQILTEIAYKVMLTLDRYLITIPADGACDEGPGYWGKAGAATIDCMYHLSCMTDGWVDAAKNEKIKNIAEFFTNAYISQNRFINFADATSVVKMDYGFLYHIGKTADSMPLIEYAKKVYKECNAPAPLPKYENQNFYNVTYYDDVQNCENTFTAKKELFLESLSYLSVRQYTQDDKGLFFAAKGGHNGESHNHNDVGNFMVYKNGQPFFIDAGAMVYNAKTFDGTTRYTLWNNISPYHNVPTINGYNQHQGGEYCAKNVQYETDDEKTVFTLDLADAYENKQDIKKWIRTFVFDKTEGKLCITEDFSLISAESITLNFLACKPFSITDNSIIINGEQNTSLCMHIDTKAFDTEITTIPITDSKLKISWKDNLYRLQLKAKKICSVGQIKYTIV